MNSDSSNLRLTPYLSPLGAWAFSFGTAIGWGSLVVTSNTYLAQAGPWGSTIGLVIGALVMIIMARNYHYLINIFPDSGGAYTYTKKVFGHDHAFLTAWFLVLTYLAIFWANDTSLPLFARFFLGDAFQFGYSYTVFGYEVYIGEVLLSILGFFITAIICTRFRKLVAYLVTGLSIILILAIAICFIAVAMGFQGGFGSIDYGFLPDSGAMSQVLLIACISPWAFIGFENISQQAEEFAFPARKAFRVMVAAIIAATLLYIFIMLMSTTAYPLRYNNWFEYLSDLGNLNGIEALPAFYAAYSYMGDAGVVLLMLALLALVLTSLFGNMVALSRLFHALAKDEILPDRFASVNEFGIPGRAVVLVALVSVVIPFLGRTAIGWIVDVTTIGATIVYGFVAAAALFAARKRGDDVERVTGALGLVIMVFFGICLLLPNFLFSHGLAAESYFLFTAWGILGFLAFRRTLHHDTHNRFGKVMIVWIGLLSLVVFFSFTWMSQSVVSTTNDTMRTVQTHYSQQIKNTSSGQDNAEQKLGEERFVEQEMQIMEMNIERSIAVAAALFAIALALLLSNYSYMVNITRKKDEELGAVKDIALTDSLTHVKSRHAFRQTEEMMNGQIAAQDVEPFAVVVCDMNDLKRINDTQGHEAGDDSIRAASSLVCKIFDHSPVFRVGGDEFAAVLKGADYENRETLIAALQKQSQENAERDEVAVASGMAEYRRGEDLTVRSVFERADARMYENKRSLKAQNPHV